MKTNYRKKIKNGKEYYFFRLKHENLEQPKDIYATNIKELEKKIKEVRAKLDANLIKTDKTYKEILEYWLYEVKFQDIKNTSKEVYDKVYKKHIQNSKIMKIKINKLNKEDIQSFYNIIKNKNIGKSIIKIIKIEIQGSIRFAYENELIIKDFSKLVTAPKIKKRTFESKKIKFFTEEEEKIFIKEIEGERLELLYILALSTGARQSELLALTWNDINFNKNYIRINKIAKYQQIITKEKRSKYQAIIQTPKTEKSIRIVPFPESIKSKIYSYKKEQEEILGNINKNNLIFCNIEGKYINGNNVYMNFKRILKRINKEKNIIPDITFHDLRHTYATRLFEKGVNPKIVQEILGHSNISITLNTYTHVSEEIKNEVSEKINNIFK